MSLPSGYTQLEYIESTGTQYIDTDVIINKSDSANLEMLTHLISNDNYAGCNGYMKFQAKIGNGAKSNIVINYSNITEVIYVNGSIVTTTNWSGYDGVNVKLGLFKLGDSNNSWFSGSPQLGKLYSCTIKKNEVVVKKFIPCISATNVVGLWDDVSGQFYTNAGTGSFIAGPETNPNLTAHKTLVNGTIYDVQRGKCMVNGTSYDIKKGRTLIGGTGYDITFNPPMPVKGDLITMNLDGTERQYRVLSVNGNICKVMGMWDDLTSVWKNDFSTTTTMGTLTVAKYEGSDIDTYLNTTWYNTLTSTAKAAIVPENVVCDAWYSGNTGDPDYTGTYGDSVPGTKNYTISKYAGGTLNIGNRNVFALGVQDVIDYLNDSSVQIDTSAILRNVNIWKMFWDVETKPTTSTYPWLRSSYTDFSRTAWYVNGTYGYMSSFRYVDTSNVVRPALNLNLNQVEFTIV